MMWEALARIMFSAAVMTAVVWLSLTGNIVGGLVIVPVVAIALRRSAESGGLRRLAHRLAPRI